MAFTIPNEAAAFHTDQAEPDAVDFDILAAGPGGTGVISGCAVTAQGTPDMTVAVASGTIAVLGVSAAVTSGNVTITAADATNPRFDLVVVNSSGTKSATAGTAASNPVFPAIPASSLVLASVYVPANDTTVNTAQITDKRVTVTTAAASSYAETNLTTELALEFGGGTTGITYSTRTGHFTKIGRMVMFSINMTLTSKGSSTGAATITGLPYTAGINCALCIIPSTITATDQFIVDILSATSTIRFLEVTTAPGGLVTVLSDTDFANTSSFSVTGVYNT